MKKIFLIMLCVLLAMPVYAKIFDKAFKGKIGDFPTMWRTWPFQRSDAVKVYKLQEEGKTKFISAYDSEDLSEQIFYRFIWDADKYPNLSWKWRPKVLPKDAREDNDDLNDSACGLYIIFGQYSGYAMKYVYSTTLPVGTVVSRHKGKLMIKVVGTGKKGVGKWQSVKTNILEDHKALFGKYPQKDPSGIALLTDGNATHSPASCDYTGFDLNK